MQIEAKIGGILYNCGGKPGRNYLDLELGMEFWNRVMVPGSDYDSLVSAFLLWFLPSAAVSLFSVANTAKSACYANKICRLIFANLCCLFYSAIPFLSIKFYP